MSDQQPQSTTESTTDQPVRDEVLLEATPSLKPVLAWLGITVLVAAALIAGIFAAPGVFGDVGVAEVAANVVLFVAVIAVARLLIQLYILTRTTYVVTTAGVRREYTLLYRTWSRELPLWMIRGHELTRSRVETALGVGTVEFLSGSVAGSMGHLKFEALPDPEQFRSRVQDQLSTRNLGGR
jgi:hypothetical protein